MSRWPERAARCWKHLRRESGRGSPESFSNQTECATLAELRDTLLPKLMSGEIRVSDAEKFVEAAL